MKTRTALGAAVLVAALFLLVAANPRPPRVLAPGGRTIGGPSTAKLAAGAQTVIFFFQGFADGGLDVCGTVVNTGKGTVDVAFYGDSGGGLNLQPGETGILCESNVDNAGATCAAGGPACSFEWRVDEVTSST
jgi:hypothetical protein